MEALLVECVAEACEADHYCPDDDLVRADAARWIYRLLEPPCVADSDLPDQDDTSPPALDGAPGGRSLLGSAGCGCGGPGAPALILIYSLALLSSRWRGSRSQRL